MKRNAEADMGGLVIVGLCILALCAGLIFYGGYMYFEPQYRVYQQTLVGQAKLKEAESSRKIVIQEAEAKLESAKFLAQAEVERAKGVAEANKIIGNSLKDNSEYLMYLWIHELGSNNNDVIYIPTEAGLPILEASRFKNPLKKEVNHESGSKK